MTFEAAVRQQSIDVPLAALEFARSIAYPDLDIAHYQRKLDDLAHAAEKAIACYSDKAAQARALGVFLFQDQGFGGNAQDYGSPANSFMNEVIDQRRGLPITAECARLVQSLARQKLEFEPAWLNESSSEETLARMLNNLRQAYVNRREWSLALKVVDQLQILHPARASHWRTRGLIHIQAGELGAALRALEQFLRRAPEAAEAEVIRNACCQIRSSIARLN